MGKEGTHEVAAHDARRSRVNADQHVGLDWHLQWLLYEYGGLKMAQLPAHAAALEIQEGAYSSS